MAAERTATAPLGHNDIVAGVQRFTTSPDYLTHEGPPYYLQLDPVTSLYLKYDPEDRSGYLALMRPGSDSPDDISFCMHFLTDGDAVVLKYPHVRVWMQEDDKGYLLGYTASPNDPSIAVLSTIEVEVDTSHSGAHETKYIPLGKQECTAFLEILQARHLPVEIPWADVLNQYLQDPVGVSKAADSTHPLGVYEW